MKRTESRLAKTHGYAPINGPRMYYEIEGSGDPPVYIPPALGCTGMCSFPDLMENHSIITVDLQGHGRSTDILERSLSIEQYAGDVVCLLKRLGIAQADFFGDSLWWRDRGHGGGPLSSVRPSCRNPRCNVWPSADCSQSGMLRFDEPPTGRCQSVRIPETAVQGSGSGA